MSTLLERIREQQKPLTTRQLSELLGLSESTLRGWRRESTRRPSRKVGPAWIRLGCAVRYEPAAVVMWVQDCAAKRTAAEEWMQQQDAATRERLSR